MDNKEEIREILTKAIEKAIDGGCKDLLAIGAYDLEKNKRGTYGLRSHTDGWINVEAIIYNHDFAKALWGSELIDYLVVDNDGLAWNTSMFAWAYHLQQMVIAKDPIKYLGDNI